MLRPRSRFGLVLRIVAALALIVVVSAALVWNSGRVRLERALAELRASGGPELPPQKPEITEVGKQTVEWFAQFADLEDDALDSTRSIDAYLAQHGSEPAVAELGGELRRLAEVLRVTDEDIADRRKEHERDAASRKEISDLLGIESPGAREDLEFDRRRAVEDAADELLGKQVPLEGWDPAARDWILTRGLRCGELLRRSTEIAALAPLDPPAKRGVERYSLDAGRDASSVCRTLTQALPAVAIRGDVETFVSSASALMACGKLYSRGWGLVHERMDSWALSLACVGISQCLQFLPPGADLHVLEQLITEWKPRADLVEALRRERAVGNELLLDFGGETADVAHVTDGWSFLEREGLRLWLYHERAGYLEMLGSGIKLAQWPPCHPGAELEDWSKLTDDLRSQHPWQLLRCMITPNLRGEASFAASLEVHQQLTLLCVAVWRDPASLERRLTATMDPFTGKPIAMRNEGGVLVFSSPAAGGELIEARLRIR
jgi:hypothetical protein